MNISLSNKLVLDFDILQQEDCRYMSIWDTSTYVERPDNPVLDITVPGYQNPIRLIFNPSEINILNSNLLNLSTAPSITLLPNLPDGVYEITYRICPLDELYITKKVLRTCEIDCKYLNAFAKWDTDCDGCENNRKLLQEVFIYINSAKAHASLCNYNKAAEFLQKANTKLSNIDCNCR